MFDGARKILDVCAGVKPNENVVIVTDTETTEVADLLAKSAREIGAEVVIVTMSPRKAHGGELPRAVAAAMKTADLILAPTSRSIGHAVARVEAQEAGARVVSLPAITIDALSGGAIEADFQKIAQIVKHVAEKLSGAKEAVVTSPSGTSISMRIGRKAIDRTSLAREPRAFATVPNIEAFVSPMEGTANGTIVVDGSILVPEIGLVHNPVRLTVEKGYVTRIEGNDEAKKFRDIIQSYKDSQLYNIAELAVALNPKAKLTSNFAEAEGAYGTIHMAVGSNFDMGGTVRAAAHIDFIITRPTVKLDGKELLKDGELDEMEKFLQSG